VQLLGSLLVPGALTLTVALVTSHQLRAREVASPWRIGMIALGASVLFALVLGVVLFVELTGRSEIQCESGASRVLLGLTDLLAIALAGVALGALAADRKRNGGSLWWQVPTGIAVVVVTLVVLAEILAVGLSCWGR
jgi:hypothetical protein